MQSVAPLSFKIRRWVESCFDETNWLNRDVVGIILLYLVLPQQAWEDTNWIDTFVSMGNGTWDVQSRLTLKPLRAVPSVRISILSSVSNPPREYSWVEFFTTKSNDDPSTARELIKYWPSSRMFSFWNTISSQRNASVCQTVDFTFDFNSSTLQTIINDGGIQQKPSPVHEDDCILIWMHGFEGWIKVENLSLYFFSPFPFFS